MRPVVLSEEFNTTRVTRQETSLLIIKKLSVTLDRDYKIIYNDLLTFTTLRQTRLSG